MRQAPSHYPDDVRCPRCPRCQPAHRVVGPAPDPVRGRPAVRRTDDAGGRTTTRRKASLSRTPEDLALCLGRGDRRTACRVPGGVLGHCDLRPLGRPAHRVGPGPLGLEAAPGPAACVINPRPWTDPGDLIAGNARRTAAGTGMTPAGVRAVPGGGVLSAPAGDLLRRGGQIFMDAVRPVRERRGFGPVSGRSPPVGARLLRNVLKIILRLSMYWIVRVRVDSTRSRSAELTNHQIFGLSFQECLVRRGRIYRSLGIASAGERWGV
ncbi:hypothetical protein YW7DRAFT_06986 [Streptomyces sp. AmelKG-E11A]|nr:hypothetical protein YW7DRAFT_06986 [Streptomyces sp. AmelKG-E11A]